MAVLAELLIFLVPLSPVGVLGNSERAFHAKRESPSAGLPVRLKIPAIGIDAAVTHAGLTSEGMMSTPKDPESVVWLAVGTIPGEEGSAVMAGHFGFKDTPAVFDTLHTLQPGDTLATEDADGMTTTFVVRAVRLYGQNEDTSDVFGSNDGKAHLNLITCEGAWDTLRESYSGRLVVFTDRE